MALRRQKAFRGSAEYAQNRRRHAATTLQRAARARAGVSRRNVAFPMPLPSTAPQGKLEVKTVQYTRSQLNCDAAPTPVHINIITQGAGNNQRLGNKCRVTGVRIKGRGLTDLMTGATDDSVVGYYLVWDKQPNQTLASAAHIWTEDTANGLYVYNTGLKVGSRDRFQVVGSFRTILGRVNTNLPSDCDINCFHKMPRSCVTTYIAGSAAGEIANIMNGALLIVPYGSKVTAPVPAIQFATELFFEEA